MRSGWAAACTAMAALRARSGEVARRVSGRRRARRRRRNRTMAAVTPVANTEPSARPTQGFVRSWESVVTVGAAGDAVGDGSVGGGGAAGGAAGGSGASAGPGTTGGAALIAG